jgi:hypothetical protein
MLEIEMQRSSGADPVLAVAELAQPILGMKRGRVSFQRAPATLNRPGGMQTD